MRKHISDCLKIRTGSEAIQPTPLQLTALDSIRCLPRPLFDEVVQRLNEIEEDQSEDKMDSENPLEITVAGAVPSQGDCAILGNLQ